MAHTLLMPKLGLSMTEGTITRWLKQEGDTVLAGDPLYEVETDKLTNIIESTVEGVLLQIVVQDGQVAPCLAPVGCVGQLGEQVEAGTASAVPEIPPAIRETAHEPRVPTVTGGRVIASPAAKKLARERGIDIAEVRPANPARRISLADVEAFLAKPPVKASGLAKKIAVDQGVDLSSIEKQGRVMGADVLAQVSPVPPNRVQAPEERCPMDGMRRVIAKRMRESRDISPDVAYDISVDMSAMKAAKAAFLAAGLKVSYTDLLVRILSRLLLEFPLMNASVDGEDILYKRYANIGVAVALSNGLLVPVVKNAHEKGLAVISEEIKRLAEAARAGSLAPDDLSGGTFTITNLGMFGIERFTPIINQPEVAILGVNAMRDSAVAVDGEITIRPMMNLSLVADHRAVDGAVAAQFLARLKQILEQPAALLL